MRWLALAALVAAGCHGSQPSEPDAGSGSCAPACSAGQACRYDTCVPQPTACAGNAACVGDAYCEPSAKECLPWGVGPGGMSDVACKNEPVPGVFFPGVQCEWLGPPAGDAFPAHVNVLATPMVAAFGASAAPSIVFPSYNFTDHGSESCIGVDPAFFGVIRVIDGATCQQQATISSPTVIASAPVAIGDLGGDDATPEIVAARSQGGLVAFTRKASGWQVLWQTQSTLADSLCDWAGPSIHDLDDDGKPEVIFFGAVYNGQTGAVIDESVASNVDSVAVGYISVVADVDGDGTPELVTGTALYSWDKTERKWGTKRGLPGFNGHVAVGDFGTYPASGQDDRAHTDGIAEVAVIYNGGAHVFTVDSREVFTASLKGVDQPSAQGGPPIIADFDGDGRAELGAAGGMAYTVLDPDCRGTPDKATCASLTTDGVLWSRPSEANALNLAGSSAFDFDGDGRAEVAYNDQCFTRLYDGASGKVLSSRARTSCSWFENPVIADVDGDHNAELITTSNLSCGVSCPKVDPLFDGASCVSDTDCPSASHCGREQASDALGRCRCTFDGDCGDGLVCEAPFAPPLAEHVCHASHTMGAAAGVHVLADTVDRWVGARAIWNQHAYSVTNIDDAGTVPRTSRWLRNWTQTGLNSFRTSPPGAAAGAHASPDLTVKQAKVTCNAGPPTVTAEVCNRGSEATVAGVPVAVYASAAPSRPRCQAQTAEPLAPGNCTTVSCTWAGTTGDGVVLVDDRGTGLGIVRECREDNNGLPIKVDCPSIP